MPGWMSSVRKAALSGSPGFGARLGCTTIPQIYCGGFLPANAIAGHPRSRRKAASGIRGILALTAQP
jgi:hypothetical protein